MVVLCMWMCSVRKIVSTSLAITSDDALQQLLPLHRCQSPVSSTLCVAVTQMPST